MEGATGNILDQIMQKFRPIAPKPVTAGSDNGVSPRDVIIKRKRVKRKYVRVKKRKNNNNNNNSLSLNDTNNWMDLESMIDVCKGNELITTDPLQKVSKWISFDINTKSSFGKINNFGYLDRSSSDMHGADQMTTVQRRKLVESWITMESVTGTCDDRKLLGYSDDEVSKNLERDTCPGFISNGYDEVVWVNQSYRKMLDLKSESDEQVAEVAVWLAVKVDKSKLVRYLPALSCRVRIEYRLSEKKTRMVVPCDVCMLDSGGFAWRLDFELALSLGPIN